MIKNYKNRIDQIINLLSELEKDLSKTKYKRAEEEIKFSIASLRFAKKDNGRII